MKMSTDHFTDVCSVTWPLNGSEAGGNLVLIQTSLLTTPCQVVLMPLTSWHLNEKAERSVSKQGQLLPRLHSKARRLFLESPGNLSGP